MSKHRAIFVELFLYFCCQYHLWLGEAHRVTFSVCNGKFEEVTFTGEKNIFWKCCVDDSSDQAIRIEAPSGTVDTGSDQGRKCLEYKIAEVELDDGGEYRCIVSNTHVDDDGHSNEVLTRYMNVLEDNAFPHCTRNGTRGENYERGDSLLMSCYCEAGETCTWTSTVVGSTLGHSIDVDVYRTFEINGITVTQVLVHYAISTDSTTRYDCFSTSTTGTVQFDSIGPEVDSSKDIITNSDIPSDSQVCVALSIQTTETTPYVSVTTSPVEMVGSSTPLEDSHVGRIGIEYIFGLTAVLVLLILVGIILFFFMMRRRKSYRTGSKNRAAKHINGDTNKAFCEEDVGSPTYYNQVAGSEPHAGSLYYNQGLGTNVITSSPSDDCATSANRDAASVDHANTQNSTSQEYDYPPRSTRPTGTPTDDNAEVEESVKFHRVNLAAYTGTNTESLEDRDELIDEYAEIGASVKSRRSHHETPSGSNEHMASSMDSVGVDHPRQEAIGEPGSGEGSNVDFSVLYAEVDKRKKKESRNEDFSGLYAAVNKSKESGHHQ